MKVDDGPGGQRPLTPQQNSTNARLGGKAQLIYPPVEQDGYEGKTEPRWPVPPPWLGSTGQMPISTSATGSTESPATGQFPKNRDHADHGVMKPRHLSECLSFLA